MQKKNTLKVFINKVLSLLIKFESSTQKSHGKSILKSNQ